MTDTLTDGTAPTITPNPDQLVGDYDARSVKLLRVRRRIGAGSVDDPVRIAVSLWTEGGDLIHEIDPARAKSEREELLEEALREALGGWRAALACAPVVVAQDERLNKRIAQLGTLL